MDDGSPLCFDSKWTSINKKKAVLHGKSVTLHHFWQLGAYSGDVPAQTNHGGHGQLPTTYTWSNIAMNEITHVVVEEGIVISGRYGRDRKRAEKPEQKSVACKKYTVSRTVQTQASNTFPLYGYMIFCESLNDVAEAPSLCWM